MRFMFAAIALLLVTRLTGRQWRPGMPPAMLIFLATVWYGINIGHLGAVQFIPVSLAAIIFYMFPLMIVACKWFVQRDTVSRLELFSFVLAFVGLAIALGPSLAESDWRGLVLAFAGALCAAVFLIVYERAGSGVDAMNSAFWFNAIGAGIGVLVLAGMFTIELPATADGVAGVLGVAVAGLVAFVLSLSAIKYAGAAATAMMLNLEPIVIFLMAAMVVGEEITPDRIVGLSFVVAALIMSQWRHFRSAEDSH